MRLINLLVLLVPTLFAACVSKPVEKQETSIPYTIERWQKDVDIPKSVRVIKFENLHGNLVLKNTPNSVIGIAAAEQRLGRKPEVAQLIVDIQGDVANFKISYPSDATKGVDAKVDGHLKGRVDLAVFVPDRLSLVLRTSFGSLEGRKLHNPVIATSRSGNLSVASTFGVRLESESGKVVFLPSDCEAANASSVKTGGTEVLVDVPTYCDLLVRAHANSLRVGQEQVNLADKRWQKRFPENTSDTNALAPELKVEAPNAAVTLMLMSQKNLF